ncbi:G protein-regulated inducer of neurite outgrowth 2 [Pseudophryne corroboree]|uniref:G protein-regulated inducer of neurite outgrowth 2 n=1 Tax=Pseudophryne corroboree TaxID=495146 RepID=UPI003082175F
MASGSHKLSTQSCQEALHLICHEKTNSGCHSLSKSSSMMPCSGPGCLQRKPETHKSLNSILCVSKCNENSMQHSHSSEWSPTQDTVPDRSLVKSDCNHLSVDYVDGRIQHRNHYRSADSSLATAAEQEVPSNIVRCNVSENISSLGHSETSVREAETLDTLDTPMIVHKSYSDYFCSSRNSITGHHRHSAIYSNLSPASSISSILPESGSDGASSLSNVTQDSIIHLSPSNVLNNLADVMSSVREMSVPLCHLDSGTIQHNITVYAVPGTYQHGVLGPRNSGNGFPNNGRMYSIPGVISCDNVSDTKLLPPAMAIQNSCSMHCCKGHEPLMKVDDTIAAYCHSLPIPSVQFSSALVHSVGDPVSGHAQSPLCSYLAPSDKFAFPKLVSSVSESGLDAKKLIKCGRLAFPQPPDPLGYDLPKNTSVQDNTNLLLKTIETLPDNLEIPDSSSKMKDTWTMTSMNYLSEERKIPLNCKDAEVQTIIIMENKAVSTVPCLQTAAHSYLSPDVGVAFTLQPPQSPVREVRWDQEGMTWEVYGAAVDPEVLGLAIQKHLEIQIEQHLQSSELSGEMEQSTKEKRRSLRTVMQSLRQSNCCGRTNSTPE